MRFFVLAIFLVITIFANSQNSRYWKKYADNAFNEGDYNTAADSYKKAYTLKSIDAIKYKWALSEYWSRNYLKAITLFEDVKKANIKKFPLTLFYLASSYKSVGKYELASTYFKTYSKNNKSNRDYFTKKAKYELKSKDLLLKLSKDSQNINLLHFGKPVNSIYSELMYLSYAPNKSFLISKRPVNKKDSLYQSCLFSLDKDSIVFCDTVLNKAHQDIGAVCFGKDTNELYLSICYWKNKKRICSIFFAQKERGEWKKPEILPSTINWENSNNIHPYYLRYKEKEYLVFSSDNSKSRGGFDLYYSQRVKNKWKKARNLGRKINSIDNEITPFYDTISQRLFFSSQWQVNLGGYDIFYAKGDFPRLGDLQNMKKPINSSYDDLYYTVDYENGKSYLSSNRKAAMAHRSATCCNDIFYYYQPEKLLKLKKDSIIKRKKILAMQKQDSLRRDSLVISNLQKKIFSLLPVNLYFDNDEPNPKTMDTLTQWNYKETLEAYLAKEEEYKLSFSDGLQGDDKIKAEQNIRNLFENKIKKNFDTLLIVNELLLQGLGKSYRIKLTVKGFASPLNDNRYNVNLSKRRVSAIRNFYKVANAGAFYNYIKNGQLLVIEEAFGENTVQKNVSDDLNDKRNSVYNPLAAEERRVQIKAVSFEKIK